MIDGNFGLRLRNTRVLPFATGAVKLLAQVGTPAHQHTSTLPCLFMPNHQSAPQVVPSFKIPETLNDDMGVYIQNRKGNLTTIEIELFGSNVTIHTCNADSDCAIISGICTGLKICIPLRDCISTRNAQARPLPFSPSVQQPHQGK